MNNKSFKKRIFVVGKLQENFISQLYTSCNEIAEINCILIGGKTFKNKFSNSVQHSLGSAQVTIFDWLQVRLLLDYVMFQLQYITKNPKALLKNCQRLLQYQYWFKTYKISSNDLVHYHFIDRNTHHPFFLKQKFQAKFLSTFWGSDLMRVSGTSKYRIQSWILKHSDLISIQTVTLREMALAKFGRHLKEKFVISKLLPDIQTYKSLERLASQNGSEENLNKHIITQFKTINIVIGHNASRYNNQKIALESILPIIACSPHTFVVEFMMTYGDDKENIDLLEKQLKSYTLSSNCRLDFIRNRLNNDDLAALMIKTHIFIHVLESDALSGFLTEMLYANVFCITGEWLPYSELLNMGVFYKTCSSPEYVGAALLSYISGEYQEELSPSKLAPRRDAIQNNLFPLPCARGWIEIYKSIANT